MTTHQDLEDPSLRPVPRAQESDSPPRMEADRAGGAASGNRKTEVSARSALVWVAVAVPVLVWLLRDLVLLIGYSVLLAYALLPVVRAIEGALRPRWRLPRSAAAAVVMLGSVTIVGWILVLTVPRLAAQVARFAVVAPEALARSLQDVRAYGKAQGLSAWLNPAIEDVRANVSGLAQYVGGSFAGWTGWGVSGLAQVLGLLVLPFLSFYLLAESSAVQTSALRFVPKGAHSDLVRLGSAVDRALRSYVRGQAIVCLVMGISVGIVLALLGSPVPLLLALVVGFAEVIPFLGFIVAASAIALAGASVSPLQALVGVAAYASINWLIGAFVTPRVMGRYLRMHPFIITVSVLAGTQIFGPAGALLALPGAAMIQAIIGELTAPPAPPSAERSPAPAEAQS